MVLGEGLRFGEDFYHPECFNCSQCATPLNQVSTDIAMYMIIITMIMTITIIITREASTQSKAALSAVLATSSSSKRLAQNVETPSKVKRTPRKFYNCFLAEGLKFREKRFHATCFTCANCQVLPYSYSEPFLQSAFHDMA